MADLETFYGGSEYLSILLAGLTLNRDNKRLLDSVIPFNEHLSTLNEDGLITETSTGYDISCTGGTGLNCTLQSAFNNSFRDIEWRAAFSGTIGNSLAGASNFNSWGIELEDAAGNIFAIRLWDNDNGTKRQIIADEGDPLTNELASVSLDPSKVTFLIRRESGVFRAFYNTGVGGFIELAFNDTIKGEIVSFRIKVLSESDADNPPGPVTISSIFLTCDGNAVPITLYDPAGLPTGEPYHLILNGGPGSRDIENELAATIITLDGREGALVGIVDNAGVNQWVAMKITVSGERDVIGIEFTQIPLFVDEGIPFTIIFCSFDSKGAISTVYDGSESNLEIKFDFSPEIINFLETMTDGCTTVIIDDETLPYFQLPEQEQTIEQGFCWFDFYGNKSTDNPFAWSDLGGGNGTQKSTNILTEPFIDRWTSTVSGAGDNPEIIGDLMKISVTGGIGDSTIRSNNTLPFPDGSLIEADFSSIVADLDSASNSTPIILRFDDGTGTNFAQIYFTNPDTEIITQLKTNSSTEGVLFIQNVIGVTDAKFKVVISGNDFLMYYNGVLVNTITDAVLAGSSTINVTIISGVANSAATQSANVSNVLVQVPEKSGILVNYFSPNLTRWSESKTGGGYQLVNGDQLQQIVKSTGSVTVNNLMPDLTVTASSTYEFITNYAELQLTSGAIIGIQRIFRKITYANGEFYEYGYENDNGTERFFVDKIGSNEFTEVAATPSSAIIKVSRDSLGTDILINDVIKYSFSDGDSNIVGFELITSNTDAAENIYSITNSDDIFKDGVQFCNAAAVTTEISGPNLLAQGSLPVENITTNQEKILLKIWREIWQGIIINSFANDFFRWQQTLSGSTGPVQKDDAFLTLESESSNQDALRNQSPAYLVEDFAIICGAANNWQVLNDPDANLTVDARMEIPSSLELGRRRFADGGDTWNILAFDESGLTLPKFLDEFFFNDESRFSIIRFSDVTYIFGEGSLMAISNTLTNDSITNATLTFINTAAGILEGKFGAFTPIRTAQFTRLILWDIPAGVFPMELMNFFIDTLGNFNTETLILSAVDFTGEIVLLNGLQSIQFEIGDNTEYKGWVDGIFITEFERNTIVSNQGSVDEVLFNQWDLALPAMAYSTLFRRPIWNTKRMAPNTDWTQTVTINAFSLLANDQEAYLLATDSKKISTGNIINRIGIRFASGSLEIFSDDNGTILTTAFGGTDIDLKMEKTGNTVSLEYDIGGGFVALDTSIVLDDIPVYFAFVLTNINASTACSANIDTLKLINKSLASGIGINTDIRLDFDMDKVLSYELYQAETTDAAPFITFEATIPTRELLNGTVRSVMLEPNEFYSWIEANRGVYNDASFTQAVPGDTIQELHNLNVDSGFPYDEKPLWRKAFDVAEYSQAAAGKRPDFVVFIFDGKDTIDFDPAGEDALEDTGTSDDRFLHDGNDFWIGLIFQSLGTGTEQAILDNSQFLNTNVGISLYLNGTTKSIKFRIRNGSTSFDHDTLDGAYDETIANLLEVEQKGITNIIKINGVVVSSLDITSFTPSTAGSSFNLTMGNKGSSGTGSPFEGYLPVVFISRRRIDTDKAKYLRNYLWEATGVQSTWITAPTSIYNKETFQVVLRFPEILADQVVLLQAFDINENLLKILNFTQQSFKIPFLEFSDDFDTTAPLNTDLWLDESDIGVAAPFIFNDLVLRQSLVSQNLLAKTTSKAPDRNGPFYLEALNSVQFPATPADDVRSMLVVEFGATVYRMGYLKDSAGDLFFKITEVGVGDIISTLISDFIDTPLIIKRNEEEDLQFVFNSITEHTIASSTATLTKWYVETEGDTSNNIITDWAEVRYKETSATNNIIQVQDVDQNIDILIDYQQADDFLQIRSTIDQTEITNRTRALILFYSERFIGPTINARRLDITNAGNGSFAQSDGGLWSWTGSAGTDSSELDIDSTAAELDGDFNAEFSFNIKEFPTGTANGSVLEFNIGGAANESFLRFYNVDSHPTFGTFSGIKVFDNLNAPGDETISLEFPIAGEYTIKMERRSGVCSWFFRTGVFPYQFVIIAGDLTSEDIESFIMKASLFASASDIEIETIFCDINKDKSGEFFLI